MPPPGLASLARHPLAVLAPLRFAARERGWPVVASCVVVRACWGTSWSHGCRDVRSVRGSRRRSSRWRIRDEVRGLSRGDRMKGCRRGGRSVATRLRCREPRSVRQGGRRLQPGVGLAGNATKPGGIAPRSPTSVASVARGGLEGAAATVVNAGAFAKSTGAAPSRRRAGDRTWGHCARVPDFGRLGGSRRAGRCWSCWGSGGAQRTEVRCERWPLISPGQEV
jgi:hypothetical protein